jgi:hypothetical protein
MVRRPEEGSASSGGASMKMQVDHPLIQKPEIKNVQNPRHFKYHHDTTHRKFYIMKLYFVHKIM